MGLLHVTARLCIRAWAERRCFRQPMVLLVPVCSSRAVAASLSLSLPLTRTANVGGNPPLLRAILADSARTTLGEPHSMRGCGLHGALDRGLHWDRGTAGRKVRGAKKGEKINEIACKRGSPFYKWRQPTLKATCQEPHNDAKRCCTSRPSFASP